MKQLWNNDGSASQALKSNIQASMGTSRGCCTVQPVICPEPTASKTPHLRTSWLVNVNWRHINTFQVEASPNSLYICRLTTKNVSSQDYRGLYMITYVFCNSGALTAYLEKSQILKQIHTVATWFKIMSLSGRQHMADHPFVSHTPQGFISESSAVRHNTCLHAHKKKPAFMP